MSINNHPFTSKPLAFKVNMKKCKWRKWKYNKQADEYLKEFYHSLGSKTWTQKLNALELKLGIVPGSQCYSHEPTDQQKVGMMEYELLGRMNLIELVLV